MHIDDSARHEIGTRVGLPATFAASAALIGHDDLAPEQAAAVARLNAMLEVAFLAAAADGEINDAEADNLGAALAGWLGTDLDEDAVEHVIERLIALHAAEGGDARLAAAARVLGPDDRRTAFTLACLVVQCDLELHDHELDVLGMIATGLEIEQAEAQARFEQVQDHIETVIANARG